MANFDLYAPTLKRWEGGFSNHPNDPGGATMMGVTLGTYRMVFGEGKSVEDLKNISAAEWHYIMKSRYWDKCKADEIMNQSVAEIFVDWVINAGANAIRKMQSTFGIKADGKVGPKTLSKLNDPNSRQTFDRIKMARESYYRKLAANKPSSAVFLRGWLNRTNSFVYRP